MQFLTALKLSRSLATVQAYKAYKLGGKVSELLYSPALYGIDLSAQNMPKPRARSSPMMAVVGNTLWLFGGTVEVGSQKPHLQYNFCLVGKDPQQKYKDTLICRAQGKCLQYNFCSWKEARSVVQPVQACIEAARSRNKLVCLSHQVCCSRICCRMHFQQCFVIALVTEPGRHADKLCCLMCLSSPKSCSLCPCIWLG